MLTKNPCVRGIDEAVDSRQQDQCKLHLTCPASVREVVLSPERAWPIIGPSTDKRDFLGKRYSIIFYKLIPNWKKIFRRKVFLVFQSS